MNRRKENKKQKNHMGKKEFRKEPVCQASAGEYFNIEVNRFLPGLVATAYPVRTFGTMYVGGRRRWKGGSSREKFLTFTFNQPNFQNNTHTRGRQLHTQTAI